MMKIAYIGNSITLHDPNPAIGWTGRWGMAASREENDYVHKLNFMLRRAGVGVESLAMNAVPVECDPAETDLSDLLADALAFCPDTVVIRLGENVPGREKYEDYIKAYGDMIDLLRRSGAADIFAVGSFWARDELDRMTRDLARAKGAYFVTLKDLQSPMFEAIGQFENAAVAAHPSDMGMMAIACRLYTFFMLAGILKV